MNVVTVDGFDAKIEYDPDTDLFRGEILGLTGGADFYGKNPKELRLEFRKSLEEHAGARGAAAARGNVKLNHKSS